MTDQRICIQCQGFFFTNGREITCRPLCKVVTRLDKHASHWFIKRCYEQYYPKIRYKKRFYDARSLLFFNDVYKRPLILCKQRGCVNPAHQRERGIIQRWFSWFMKALPLKGE